MNQSRPMLLRLKTKDGQKVLKDLNSNSTVDEMITKISSLINVSPSHLKIRFGFPPKPLDTSQKDAVLSKVSIVSGDTLIIEETIPKFETKSEDNIENNFNLIPNSSSAPGILMRKVVPADNSCLFTSIHYLINNGDFNLSAQTQMRQIIAKTVSQDSTSYSEAFLGKSNDEYCQWIQNDQTWGGAIEVAILSKHFKVEIVVVDTQHIRLNHFGEDFHYKNRILLIYDGIHYDPLHLEIFDESSTTQTIFLCEDSIILDMALELAKEAKHSRQFTDVNNFQLRCIECNKPLKGQVEAQEHAKLTMHTNFGEV